MQHPLNVSLSLTIASSTMSSLPPNHPDREEEVIPPFSGDLPSDETDVIPAGEVLPAPTPNPAFDGLALPRVILGCAPFGYGVYADKDAIRSSMPVRIVRAALRAGINAFDTAPHYHPSEIILGHALQALKDEFPRESYSIITKAAKYGPMVSQHYYDPEVVKRSVERSLKRLHTSYLDIVYLHDVEFVASKPFPCPQGDHLAALESNDPVYAMDSTEPEGDGDRAILASYNALRELQAEGKIKRVGIAGYSLPVLLRLSRLVRAKTGKGIDVVQTYAHQTVHCSTLEDGYLAAFEDAQVGQIVNAAPLSMGILTTGGGPDWHPGKKVGSLYSATREAVILATDMGSTIEAVACGFGYRTLTQRNGAVVPVVIGCTNLAQLHQTLQSYAEVNGGQVDKKRELAEKAVMKLFEERGVRNVSWQSPAPDSLL